MTSSLTGSSLSSSVAAAPCSDLDAGNAAATRNPIPKAIAPATIGVPCACDFTDPGRSFTVSIASDAVAPTLCCVSWAVPITRSRTDCTPATTLFFRRCTIRDGLSMNEVHGSVGARFTKRVLADDCVSRHRLVRWYHTQIRGEVVLTTVGLLITCFPFGGSVYYSACSAFEVLDDRCRIVRSNPALSFPRGKCGCASLSFHCPEVGFVAGRNGQSVLVGRPGLVVLSQVHGARFGHTSRILDWRPSRANCSARGRPASCILCIPRSCLVYWGAIGAGSLGSGPSPNLWRSFKGVLAGLQMRLGIGSNRLPTDLVGLLGPSLPNNMLQMLRTR